ncbi:carbohydrate sulfotransferase 15-like [Pecten maximus]|uniref:carbohydrate sulfotransferase 15-like n=1 Tax=Pecten maximus TaxID=6579 RepID=UPI00145905A4|nr:carbohydrate sulfotransferase 15-like [Pecten maximus]
MAYRKGFNLRSVSFIAVVLLIAFSVYYCSVGTDVADTNTDDQSPSRENHGGNPLSFTSKGGGNQHPRRWEYTSKHGPFISTGGNELERSPSKENFERIQSVFTPKGGGNQPQIEETSASSSLPSKEKSTEKQLLQITTTGGGRQTPSQDKSAGNQVQFNQRDKFQPQHEDNQSSIYRQRFLDFAKEDVLHTKSPTYLPTLKNPCWYENNTVRLTLRCLPYFMVLGQNKCGTTHLYSSIVKHPDVIPATGKEPQFWARSRHCYCCRKLTYEFLCHHDRPWKLKGYIRYFDPIAKKIQKSLNSGIQKKITHSAELITGEATPSNLWDNRWWWNYMVNKDDTEPPALTNAHYIHHFMPNLKIIIILRNPTSRLYSDYLYVSQGKVSPEGFHEEVIREINSFQNCSRTHDIRYCVFRNSFDEKNVTSKARLQNGFYAVFIEEYMKLFPREQFHIIRLEDYAKHNTEVMAGIFRFLNLRDLEKPMVETKINSSKSKGLNVGKMLPETEALVTEFYKPYTEHLADLLNDKRFLWHD